MSISSVFERRIYPAVAVATLLGATFGCDTKGNKTTATSAAQTPTPRSPAEIDAANKKFIDQLVASQPIVAKLKLEVEGAQTPADRISHFNTAIDSFLKAVLTLSASKKDLKFNHETCRDGIALLLAREGYEVQSAVEQHINDFINEYTPPTDSAALKDFFPKVFAYREASAEVVAVATVREESEPATQYQAYQNRGKICRPMIAIPQDLLLRTKNWGRFVALESAAHVEVAELVAPRVVEEARRNLKLLEKQLRQQHIASSHLLVLDTVLPPMFQEQVLRTNLTSVALHRDDSVNLEALKALRNLRTYYLIMANEVKMNGFASVGGKASMSFAQHLDRERYKIENNDAYVLALFRLAARPHEKMSYLEIQRALDECFVEVARDLLQESAAYKDSLKSRPWEADATDVPPERGMVQLADAVAQFDEAQKESKLAIDKAETDLANLKNNKRLSTAEYDAALKAMRSIVDLSHAAPMNETEAWYEGTLACLDGLRRAGRISEEVYTRSRKDADDVRSADNGLPPDWHDQINAIFSSLKQDGGIGEKDYQTTMSVLEIRAAKRPTIEHWFTLIADDAAEGGDTTTQESFAEVVTIFATVKEALESAEERRAHLISMANSSISIGVPLHTGISVRIASKRQDLLGRWIQGQEGLKPTSEFVQGMPPSPFVGVQGYRSTK